MLLFVKEDR